MFGNNLHHFIINNVDDCIYRKWCISNIMPYNFFATYSISCGIRTRVVLPPLFSLQFLWYPSDGFIHIRVIRQLYDYRWCKLDPVKIVRKHSHTKPNVNSVHNLLCYIPHDVTWWSVWYQYCNHSNHVFLFKCCWMVTCSVLVPVSPLHTAIWLIIRVIDTPRIIFIYHMRNVVYSWNSSCSTIDWT